MSSQPGGGQPISEELRRRRAAAVAVLVAAFLLFLLAVVSAIGIGGGDDNRAGSERRATTTERQARRPARRPARRATPPGITPVPANAPGAHRAAGESVPILAYNVINTPREDTANPDEWVPPDEFEAQMNYLAQQGYHVVTLRQVWAAWKEGGLLPSKPIVISFDTGYHSVYANASPALRSRGWVGTLFLRPSQLQADFPASEVKALVQAGWELDAQGEEDSSAGGPVELRQQLQRDFGARVEFFSYPTGSFEEALAGDAQSGGFLGAATDEEGLASPQSPPFELDRIQVRNGFGEEGLAQALQAAGA